MPPLPRGNAAVTNPVTVDGSDRGVPQTKTGTRSVSDLSLEVLGLCHVGHCHNLHHAHRMTRHGTVSPPLVVDVHFRHSFRFVG